LIRYKPYPALSVFLLQEAVSFHMKRIVVCLIVCTVALGCVDSAYAGVRVEHAWVRVPPPVADTAAAYMTLYNEGDKDVIVARVSSDVSGTSGIHVIQRQGAVMRMSAVGKMTIPAHGSVKLEPGGMHVMLTAGLNRVLKQGQTVRIVLYFTDGDTLKLDAPVRDPQVAQEPAQPLYEQAMDLARKKKIMDAATLFQKAGEQGNRRAQYQLGLLYARGDGVPKNLIRARELLHKAAMQGHPKAQFHLGQMYAFGDGGEKDNMKATMWFWLATTLGDRYARDSLRVMTGKISPIELVEAKKRAGVIWKKIPHDMKIKHAMTMH